MSVSLTCIGVSVRAVYRYCGQCRERRPALTTMTVVRAPEVLVINLKRFQYSRYKLGACTHTAVVAAAAAWQLLSLLNSAVYCARNDD